MSESTSTPQGTISREEAERLVAASALHRFIGLELAHWEPGRVHFRLNPPAAVQSGAGGIVHGGALMTALDVAACFAVMAVTGHDCSTVDLRADFVRPATGGELAVTGQVLKVGRRFGRADASITDGEGRMVALARGTFAW